MTVVIYWPREEHDCTEETRSMEHPDTVHIHCETDEQAVNAYIEHLSLVRSRWPQGIRYRCITGPGGLVRNIKEVA